MESLIAAFKSQTNGAADGTGVIILVSRAKKLLGNDIPPLIINYTLGIQHSIFGDYPTTKDIAPSAIFMVTSLIFMLAHLFIFMKNYSRGHKFWLSLGFSSYNMIRFIGWAMRIAWSKDILRLKTGIASSVFIIVPIVILASLNLVLAQRIFTLYHPKLGSSTLFWTAMIIVYIVVSGVVVMAILGAVIPYIYFLSEHHFNMCKKVVQAAAILCMLYSVLAMILLIIATILPPTKATKAIVTYQPWWIESFDANYYVPKGSCRQAEESFKSRDPSLAKHCIRVIASTSHEHKYDSIQRVQSVTSKSGVLDHTLSNAIIFITTFILTLSSTFRCVSTFIDDQKQQQSWIFKPVVMYIMFGLLETVVNIFYLVGRVDLRFYRPDRLKNLDHLNDHEILNGSNPDLSAEKLSLAHQNCDNSSVPTG